MENVPSQNVKRRKPKKKKSKGFMGIFIAVILLGWMSLLGSEAQWAERQQKKKALERRAEGAARETLKDIISDTDDPDVRRAAMEEHTDRTVKMLDQYFSQGSESEKAAAKVMTTWSQEGQALRQRWNDAFREIQSPEMFDMSRLKVAGELKRQKAIAERYISDTRAYGAFCQNAKTELKRRFAALGENPAAEDIYRGSLMTLNKRWPIMAPLIEAHLKYGQRLLDILNFIQKHRAGLVVEGYLYDFGDTGLNAQFESLVTQLGQAANVVIELNEKMQKNL